MSNVPRTTSTPPPSPGPGEPAPDRTGSVLGDFRVLHRLGQGGMGQVYLAEQLSLKRKVALKILRPDLAAHPAELQRFKAEAEAVARATHANIVQVYAIGEADGLAYMALEYVEGRNLREYVAKKGPPDLLLALSIMRQVAAALQRAAELGIIHRDVKPENILLTRKGEVKVADFGLSRCLAGDREALHLTQSGVTLGTPLYMSPEQVEGRTLDPRTDIYSFGVTCYHMLTGHPPFRGETAFEVALQHVRAEPVPLATVRPDLPEGLAVIVHKMMAKEPAQRYQTGRDLLRDVVRLRESLSGQLPAPPASTVPVEAPAFPSPAVALTTTHAPAPAPRQRRLPALFALSLVLALGAGALAGWARRHAQAPTLPALTPPVRDENEAEQGEKALRQVAEKYLAIPGSSFQDVSTGFGLCLGLGLFYLEADRLDDADALFQRLERFPRVRPYHILGQLGRAVVLALRDDAEASNKLFRKVFEAPPYRGLGPKRLAGGGVKLQPEFQLWQNPRWRSWVARALWYNHENGLPDDSLPPALKPLLRRR